MRTDNTARKKKKFKPDSRFFARILVILIAAAMLMGTLYYAIMFMSVKSVAESSDDIDVGTDIYVRIQILCDENITCSVRLTAENGFDIGYTNAWRNTYKTDETSLTELYVSRHVNLVKSGTKYERATSDSNVTVGCYHVDIVSDENYAEDVALLKEAFPEYNIFPANVNGEFHVLIGQFSTSDAAAEAMDAIKAQVTPPSIPEDSNDESSDSLPSDTDSSTDDTEAEGTDGSTSDTEVDDTDSSSSDSSEPEETGSESESETADSSESDTSETTPDETEPEYVPLLPDELTQAVLSATVHTPGRFATIVIDPSSNRIIWVHNSDSGAQLLGLAARQDDSGNKIYLKCHSSSTRIYDGYFEFAGYSPAEYFGVRVINLVKMENYIVGVCSAEIPTNWPMETIKAFSIAVRSYTIRSLTRHIGNNADLCNTSHCQVFNGYGPAVDRVWRAVAATRGIVAVSNGSICGTYYSSSTGGCTANCTDVWGSSLLTYPYLKAVATPWEQYRIHNRGQRTTTVNGTALYNKLVEKGYTALTGPVTDVKITKTGNNTTYVTEIKFYDAAGNCQTVTRADRIKKLLGDYLYSSNFVVVKSGETAVRTNYTLMGFGGINPEETTGVDILGNPNKYSVFGHQLFSVVTSNGTKTFYDSKNEKVATADGIKDFNMAYSLDSQVYPTVIGVNGEVLPDILQLTGIAESESIETTKAENSFTFIGRGWGHGVGLSQYGIYDLGNLGYDYLTILKAYYTGIKYMTYKEFLGK